MAVARGGPLLLLLCLAPGWCGCLAASSAPPGTALVFEASSYLASLAAAPGADKWELVLCDAINDHCGSLADDVRQRVSVVIGQPRDISLLSGFPALRLVHSTTFMYPQLDQVPKQAAVASYMPDWREVYGVEPIAEWVLAAVFDWNYRLRETGARFAACAWGDDAPQRCPPTSSLTSHPVLMNQTIGVLGYGKIGQAVARRSAALGMRTVATKVYGPFSPPPPPLTWLSGDNDRLYAESDFVVMTLPGSAKGVVNATALKLMKPGAVVIPISAPPVDFDALYEALEVRQIGGAVIDVWPHGCWNFPEMQCGPPFGAAAEPYPRDIQKLDNALVLPGMAMRDAKFWSSSAAWVAENLRAEAEGRPIRGVVRNATSDIVI